jgi:hypothetical protein
VDDDARIGIPYDWKPGRFARVWDALVWDIDDRPDGTLDLYCVADRIAGADRMLTGVTWRAMGTTLNRSHQWVQRRLAWLIDRGYVVVVDPGRSHTPASYRLTDVGGLGIIRGF